MFARGATTLWETMVPSSSDGRLPTGSHNHPMQGGFDAWFYSGVAGINPTSESPGFKHIVLQPRLIKQLQWAGASYRSMYGLIESKWRNEEDTFQWRITIPPNTTAMVYVPTKNADNVTESGVPAAKAEGVKFLGIENSMAVFAVVSGRYQFVSKTGPKRI
jgi:alpha-L-rhamnosidase